jgi:hypothetical protein
VRSEYNLLSQRACAQPEAGNKSKQHSDQTKTEAKVQCKNKTEIRWRAHLMAAILDRS